jgi:serine kinase of HPr protein (carbohydrate metabolism regulator)
MATLSSDTLHASCVAIGGCAILIEGLSGSGKSDLTLRLIDRGAVLVSDDYTYIKRAAAHIIASPPPTIAGKLEVRGLGIMTFPFVSAVPVALIVSVGEPVERLPGDGRLQTLIGVPVPLVALAALEGSAPIKVELALKLWGLKLQ